jgi:hypothetical protein
VPHSCGFYLIKMAEKKSSAKKATNQFAKSMPNMERWWLCQRIAKSFYDAEISYEKLLQMQEYFLYSDFLKDCIFTNRSTP